MHGDNDRSLDVPMTLMWIVGGIGVAGIVAKQLLWRGARRTDLGSVSHQWLVEHRITQISDPHR
jgi:hypothetical protein